MRKARPRTGRRVAMRFGLLVIACGVLVVWAGTTLRETPAIIAPETPEATAKRQSPDNAYYTLVESQKLLPPKPPMLRIQGEYGEEPYQPEEGSIGKLVEVWRPDDDPETIRFLEDHAPMIAKLEEALSKPYFYLPQITPFWDWESSRRVPRFVRVRAYAMYQERLAHDPSRALEVYILHLRLAHLCSGDGNVTAYGQQTSEYFEIAEAVARLLETNSVPAETIDAAIASVEHVRSNLRSVEDVLQAELRILAVSAAGTPPDVDVVNRFFLSRRMKKMERFFTKHRDALAEYARLDDCAARAKAGTLPQLPDPFIPDAAFLESAHSARAWAVTALNGLLLVLRVEQYRGLHGAYPESLEVLASAYPGTALTDGHCDQPFVYRVEPAGYWLYSCGADQRDNGVTEGDDKAIHLPAGAGPTHLIMLRSRFSRLCAIWLSWTVSPLPVLGMPCHAHGASVG